MGALGLTIAFAVLLLVLGTRYIRRSNTSTRYKLPPGPRGIPILGNVLQVPGTHLATYFRGLLADYGGLVSLNLAGFPVVLIGDIKLAKDILDKHSAKHSSRPAVPYVRHHLDPTDIFWAATREGKSHSIGRKLTAGLMSAVRSGKTQLLQEFEAKLNIQKLLDDGGRGWYHHMERLAASTPLSAGFGVHCPTGDEPVLKDVLGVLDELVNLSAPSASIINVLPFLDLIPGPMPWRTRAKSFRMRDADVYGRLVEDAVTGKNSGMNTWAAAFADVNKPEGDQRQLLSQLNAGAIETTSALLQSFVLACIRYPKWMTWAQREIDAIVGPDRLPSFTDRPFLPCVEAILRETLRWRPAARFGLPHQSIADDVIEYQGQEYFIPKGSVIFGVTWAIEHDGTRFESPDDFMPERFLDAEGKLKSNYETSAFGFGRRVCPGIPFAERTLWINIATMLWNFDIQGSNELDPNTGSPHIYDDSDAAFSGYVTNPPFKFPAVFRSRSLQREEVARREWAECEKDLNVLLPAPKSDN